MVSIFKILVFIITDLLFYLAAHYYFISIFDGTQRYKLLYYIPILIISLFISVYTMPSYLSLIVGILLSYFVSTIYSKQYVKNILYCILFEIIGGTYELLTVLIVTALFSQPIIIYTDNSNIIYTIEMFFSRFLMLLSAYILYTKRSRIKISEYTTRFWLVISIFSLCSMYIIYILCKLSLQGKITEYSDIAFLLGIIVFFNLTIYSMYDKQCNDSILKQENQKLSEQIHMQKLKEAEADSYIQKVYSLRHDFKNQYIGLIALMEDKKYSDVLNILKSSIDVTMTSTNVISDCHDSVIGNIVTYKTIYAEKYNVSMNSNIMLTKSINISSDDLSIMLGNLIDNAIEYLTNHNDIDKTVNLYITYDYGIVKIVISNPVIQDIAIPDDYLIPTEKVSDGHGYGIKSVKKIVDKYKGEFYITCADKMFSTNITIFV